MEQNSKTHRLMAALRKMKSVDIWDISSELPKSELICLHNLCYLEEKMEKTGVSLLIDTIHMHAAAVSRALKNLEKKGLIIRSIDPNNHRNVLVNSTLAGRELNSKLREQARRYWNDVFARIPDADVDLLIDMLNEMTDSMKEVLQIYKSNIAR